MKKVNKYADFKERDEYERILLEYNNHYGINIGSEHICNLGTNEATSSVNDYSYLKKR